MDEHPAQTEAQLPSCRLQVLAPPPPPCSPLPLAFCSLLIFNCSQALSHQRSLSLFYSFPSGPSPWRSPRSSSLLSSFLPSVLSITEGQLPRRQELTLQQVYPDRRGRGLPRGFPSEACPPLQLPGTPQGSAHTCLWPAERGGVLSPRLLMVIKQTFWKEAGSAKTDWLMNTEALWRGLECYRPRREDGMLWVQRLITSSQATFSPLNKLFLAHPCV